VSTGYKQRMDEEIARKHESCSACGRRDRHPCPKCEECLRCCRCHQPTFNRYRRGHSMLGGNCYGYTIRCTCGWTKRWNGPKREAMQAFRDHVFTARRAAKETSDVPHDA